MSQKEVIKKLESEYRDLKRKKLKREIKKNEKELENMKDSPFQ